MIGDYNVVTSGIVLLVWDECKCEPLLGNSEEFSDFGKYMCLNVKLAI